LILENWIFAACQIQTHALVNIIHCCRHYTMISKSEFLLEEKIHGSIGRVKLLVERMAAPHIALTTDARLK